VSIIPGAVQCCGVVSAGLVVAVIIGVLLGVVIGAVPLGLAYVCLKRYTHNIGHTPIFSVICVLRKSKLKPNLFVWLNNYSTLN